MRRESNWRTKDNPLHLDFLNVPRNPFPLPRPLRELLLVSSLVASPRTLKDAEYFVRLHGSLLT